MRILRKVNCKNKMLIELTCKEYDTILAGIDSCTSNFTIDDKQKSRRGRI